MKVVVLINCGGGINILELLEPEDDVNFYILDRYDVCMYYNFYNRVRPFQLLFTVSIIFLSSQRPLELDNVYNQDQVSNFCLVHVHVYVRRLFLHYPIISFLTVVDFNVGLMFPPESISGQQIFPDSAMFSFPLPTKHLV